jgi:hypothetical protein
MKTSSPQNDLLELLDSLSQGTLDREQAALLEQMVARDPAARELYVAYMHLRVNAQYLADVQRGSFDTADLIGALADEDAENGTSDTRTIADGGSDVPSAKLGVPVSPAFPSSLTFGGTFGYFTQTVPFSYLVATVLVGLGLLTASMITVSPMAHVASIPPHVIAPMVSPTAESVGRITGMVDCRWLGANAATTDRAQVPLGRKYALASGMLEITYNSGAKVILQGPATYQVESATGGYLSIGKLTARLETEVRGQKSEVRGQRSESANQKSEIKNQKFVVRTPTAVVTDLGTEFGVEVSSRGVTRVHVLQGVVDAQVVGPPGKTGYHERVTEGGAVEIRAANAPIEKIAFVPQAFARNMQPAPRSPAEAAYIKAVLADGPMGYWPLNESAGAGKCFDRSGKEIHGFAMRKTKFGQPGPFGDNSNALALDGNGYIDLGRHDEFAMKNNFTVEAWAWIGNVAETSYVISALGRKGEQNIGCGKDPLLLYLIVQDAGHFNFPISEGENLENRWIHVAVAFDRDNKARLYLNGSHRGSVTRRKSSHVGPMWLQIGCAEVVDTDFWHGRLAHVAVYPRALTGAEIKNHYDQRNVDAKEVADKHP